jgi:hypothetical protein
MMEPRADSDGAWMTVVLCEDGSWEGSKACFENAGWVWRREPGGDDSTTGVDPRTAAGCAAGRYVGGKVAGVG